MNETQKLSKDLNEIVDHRITSLVRELEDAGWPTDEIVMTIDAVMKNRWIDRMQTLEEARAATPKNFISDGNEG